MEEFIKIEANMPKTFLLDMFHKGEEEIKALNERKAVLTDLNSYLRKVLNIDGVPVATNGSVNRNAVIDPDIPEDQDFEMLPNGYIKQWPWAKKILFVLEESGKRMSAKQIGDYILNKLEPEIDNKKRVGNTISGQLSVMHKAGGILNRSENVIGDYVYEPIRDGEQLIRTNSSIINDAGAGNPVNGHQDEADDNDFRF